MAQEYSNDAKTPLEADGHEGREVVVPLLQEEISVSKQVVQKTRVRVETVTREHEGLVDELLAHEHVEIERVAIDKPVDVRPGVREEGDTIVIPVVEEVLIVERRLILKEEVRVRKIRETERHQERVMLRKQEAVVTRIPLDNPDAAGG